MTVLSYTTAIHMRFGGRNQHAEGQHLLSLAFLVETRDQRPQATLSDVYGSYGSAKPAG